MNAETIYIVGAGAIGSALAAQLSHQGRDVVVVRTSRSDVMRGPAEFVVRDAAGSEVRASIDTVSLDLLEGLQGIVAITAKSYANADLARKLADRGAKGPIVILQNGLGIEESFIAAGFTDVYRCVLFTGGERQGDGSYAFRAVKPSPIGIVTGDAGTLRRIVRALDTPAFPFTENERIQEVVWQKTIMNAVFNSICPLLDVDNGVFERDARARDLARGIVDEGVAVAKALGMTLDPGRLMEQLLVLSRGSTGQTISTLQDIRRGNQTEIASLNLAIAKMGAEATPPVRAEQTALLGRMVELKAALGRAAAER